MKVFVLLAAVSCVYGLSNDEGNIIHLDVGSTVDTDCKACQDIVKSLRLILNSNKTQVSIKDFVENKVCTMLGTSAALCKQYVESYIPILLQLLGTELDSLKFCNKIGLCPAQQQVLQAMFHSVDSKPVNTDITFGGCFICKMIIEKLYAELGQHATEAEIAAYLEKVCNIMPHAFRSECVSLIDKFTPTIIKLVMKKMTPQQICVEIRLCSATTQTNNTLRNLFYISPVN